MSHFSTHQYRGEFFRKKNCMSQGPSQDRKRQRLTQGCSQPQVRLSVFALGLRVEKPALKNIQKSTQNKPSDFLGFSSRENLFKITFFLHWSMYINLNSIYSRVMGGILVMGDVWSKHSLFFNCFFHYVKIMFSNWYFHKSYRLMPEQIAFMLSIFGVRGFQSWT